MKQLILAFFLLIAFKTSLKAINTDTLYVNPNPCDSILIINFSIAQNDSVSLDLLSIIGQTVTNFYNKALLPIGNYTINYVSYYLPDGVYFLELKRSAYTKIIKIIKAKGYVGINEQTVSNLKTKVFPNPTTNYITIDNQDIKEVYLYNQYGSIGLEKIIDKNVIDLSAFPSGIYLLNIFNAHHQLILNQKIIKMDTNY